MAEEETTALTELETVEISLVDKGANRRVFAIRKAERNTMEVINAILAAPFEHNDAILERLKKAELSEQAVEALKSAVQILSAFQEEVPGGLMKELMLLSGMAKQEEEEEEEEAEKQEEEEEEEEAPPVESDGEEEDEEEMQKRLAALPKNMRGMVSQLWKSNREAVTKATELEAKIQKAEDEKRLSECTAQAGAELSALPATAQELGSFLKSLDGADKAHAKFVRKLLKSTNEMIATGNITGEIGKTTTGAEMDAIAKAEQMATAMVEKEGITKARALANVWKSNPHLYAEYQQQKTGR